jgi:uncharacterized membrane protein YphA (DoxX/SURF4 family)
VDVFSADKYVIMKNTRFSEKVIIKALAMVLGLVLIAAGTGKALGQSDFIYSLEGSFFTPALANITGHFLPWIEITLGALLIIGVFPKIMSVLSIGLITGFVASNLWLLVSKPAPAITCGDCFGIWERVFGSLSPLQALFVDFALIGLALVVSVRTRAHENSFQFRVRNGGKA